ncbi:MAG: hypothetical protein R2845_10100, partial [Thermomicrobiales bacterium]
DGIWQSVAIQDGVGIEYGLSEGQTLDCRWYNFPIVETGAYVLVTKYLCDPNADLISASRIGLKSRCVPLSGVQFSLATSGEPSWSRLTGPSGQASWDAVPSGEFGLAERTTTGYRTPIVYCSLNGGLYERVIVSGGSIQQVVADSDEIHCDWYNVPYAQVAGPTGTASGTGPSTTGQVPLGGNQGTPGTQTGTSSGGPFSTGGSQTPTGNQGTGPATLTIASYLCPSGFDLYATDSEPRAECDEGEEPISFTLTPWGEDATGDPVTRSTGTPQLNVVTFTDVDAGDYMVSLEPPDDPIIAWAFVLTCESSLGQADSSRFYPLALTGDNLGLRLTLYAGETLRCSWYNVPETSNLVDVSVYECPGRIANPSRCVPGDSSHVIYFMPIDTQLETVRVETDSEGTATAELAPGAYTVEDEELTACLVDSSSMDDDGNLIVEGEDAIEVVVYTCSG